MNRSVSSPLARLSRGDLTLLLDLTDASLRARDDAGVSALLERVRSHVPTSGVAAVAIVSRSVPAAEPALKCLNAGFSEEWIGEYSRNGYFACDATKRPEHAASGFVAWSAALGRPANDAERKYARRARECGVSAGVTVGVDEPHGPQTWFAFIGRAVERGDREAILLRHLTPYLHESMCRAAAARPAQDDQDRATLTPREREVLCWAMSGKTNWEISVILRVSERTVKFHLRNVMVKLDVSTRAHAVAVALSRGLIMFAE